MTNIPATFATTNNRDNIFRALSILQSVAAPSPTVEADTAQSLVKMPATAGAKGWFDAFRMQVQGTQTAIHAELPLSTRVYGSTGNLRKSIRPLPGSIVAAWTGAAGGGTAPTAASLEQALFDMFQTFLGQKAADETIAFSHEISATSGRSYLLVNGLVNGGPADFLALSGSVPVSMP
jgi:hypothetical protein